MPKFKKIRTFFKHQQLPIISGILIGTSYIPLPPWASLFLFVPLWLHWQNSRSLKEVFFAGWVTQFVLTFIGFHWVTYTLHEFGGLPKPIAYLGLFIFCGFANLYIPLAGMIWFKLRSGTGPGLHSLLTLPMILWLMETLTPTIFKWNLGYPFFWIQLPAYHLAEFIGSQGLSAIVIFANFLCLMIWTHRHQRKTLIKLGVTLLTLLIGINLLGWKISQQLEAPDKTLRALVVQANIGNMEKVYAEKGWGFRSHIANKYVQLTQSAIDKFRNTEDKKPDINPVQKFQVQTQSQAAGTNSKLSATRKQNKLTKEPKIDFTLWPETAFPNNLGKSQDNNPQAQKIFQMIRQTQTPLITGGYSRSPNGEQPTNSVFFIDENAQYTDEAYHKTHLLAFGEYIPMAHYFPRLKRWLPQVGDFYRGHGPSVKSLNGLKIGTQICYESLFPSFSIELANKGAQILINVTNDSWYGTQQEPYQHLYPALARAVEMRIPLIRSTNTGISTAILASGNILEASSMNKEWSHIFEIPYTSQPKTTLYQAFPWLLPLIVFMLLLRELRAAYRENHTNS